MQNVLIAGISGAIGSGIALELLERDPSVRVIGLCRSPGKVPEAIAQSPRVSLLDWDAARPGAAENVAASLVGMLAAAEGLDDVVFAAGILHGAGMFPEKRVEDLDGDALVQAFQVNAASFALLIRALMPWLKHRRFKRVVAISAKVGSISDNRFGGWYAYRSSKAALNMLVKTLSVELPRRCKPVACVAVHPGTTRSALSEPFAASLAQLEVHSAGQTATNILAVMDALDESGNGCFYNWDGAELPW
ncbi:SDR family NAD(P)-dependent oxidoreductase [Marinobacter sp. M-5]|uniref:SDR family NAD(P)-dependent oxidoreductase n=1 Tax=Marinobacter sp. M-5 TaxID=3081089 RepID=UPI00293C3F72|nr:SDR family NAD(P)-dependent oxidoreductase [Marinobacter sp. M-5]MDV3504122.1 SDR family NAD(P)-dependent oxidoreductase [Marinobacter sp. M-5]